MENEPSLLDLRVTRRDFLIHKIPGLLALLAGLPALAEETRPTQEQERVELIKDFQQKTLQFDALALIERVFTSFGIPAYYFAQFKKMSKGRDMENGLTSIRKIFDCKEPDCDPRFELIDKIFRDPHVQNRLYRKTEIVGMVKGDKPQSYEEMRQKLVESIVGNTLGIDLQRLREHVTRYKEKDMAIFYGPVTNFSEFLGTILHEPFALYLQTIYGRQATEFFSESHPQSMEKLKEILLDPKYQFLAMASHGSWNSFSMSGVHISPDEGMKNAMQYWQSATEAYKKDPKKTLAGVFRVGIEDLLMKKKEGAVFTEQDLQKLIAQKCLTPVDAARVKKHMVVRYTCGEGRGSAEAPDGFGTSIVRDRKNARGFEGIAWLDDYIRDPIPDRS